jgi:predicted permease
VPLTTLGTALDDVSGRSSPPAHVVVTGMAAAIAGDAPRTLGVLAGSAGLATLLAFANLTGLLMVRSIDRRRELAVRTALGARRSEIARQLVLEAEMLAGMGIIGGVLVALWTTPAIGRLGLAQFGGVANGDVPASWRAIVVIAVLGVVCAAISGSLPALMAARHDVVDALRRGSTLAPREVRLRRVLVGAEVAIAFLLLVCVTFLGTSLVRALTQNPGFDADGVLTLQVSVPASRYPTSERVAAFYADLQRAIDERLGAGRAAIINEIPLTGDGGRGPVRAQPTDVGMEAVVREAGASYFDVMRIPVVAGRAFDARSSAAGQPVVVVSESLAQRLFGVVSPIGRHIIAAGEDSEIIGIVGDVKHRALDAELSPTVYISALRSPSRSRIVVARSTRPDADVIAAVREAVARLDGDLPVYRVRTMRDVIDTSPGVPTRRVLAAAFAGFAVLAIILGGIGLFGLVAHDVARRRTEIALRVALGAGPMRILATAVAQGSVVVACGLAVGGILSFWAIGALRTVLASADHLDMWGIGAAATLVIMAAACAVLPPALQAIRIDPIIALRAE